MDGKKSTFKGEPLAKRVFEEFCSVAGIPPEIEGKVDDYLLYCLLSAFS